ncbi:MAG: hypothetical protein HY700_21345, partial [Gemmatimonadetes bacterium]|nr:hypothetical protein [Gemmatimonadota bacterium]
MHLSIRASALAVLLVGGCHHTLGPEAAVVLGDWEWMAACCSIAGAERTPATEGYTYVLQFSDKGTVEVVRNNAVILTTRFTATRSRPSPTADEITLVHYDTPLPHGPSIPSADEHMVLKLENGTLILRNPHCADCYGEWTFLP